MEEAFNEIAHPFGGVAFVEPLRRRSAFPSRQMVAYGEGDAEATLEDGELPAAADDVAGHWVSACPKKAARGKQQRPAKVRAADGAEPPPHESAMEEGEVQEAASDGTAGEGAAGASSEGGPAKRAKPANAKAASEKKGFSPVPPPGYVCNACHSTGHWLEQCPRRDEYRKGAPPTGYVCVKCNQAGHWVHNCTAAPKGGWKEHSAADGRSQAVESLVVGPAAREVGDEIAEALEEEAPEVVSLMHRCVEALGEAACRQLLVQTWQVEASGGLLTTDGSNRRRTPGGVFFWLVKQKASAEDRARIFSRPAESAISKPPSGE